MLPLFPSPSQPSHLPFDLFLKTKTLPQTKAMTRSQGEEVDHLGKKFQHLKDDWNSFKQSFPRHRRSCSATDMASAVTVNSDLLKLIHDSPKKLISSLQQSQPPSDVSMPKAGDRRVGGIMTERRAAIKSGKLRGKRLLEALEGAREEVVGLHGGEEICSVCSSVLIQGWDTNSSCSCCSSMLNMHGYNNYGRVYLSSSSSSPTSFSMENVGREREVGVGRERDVGVGREGGVGGGGGELWMWRMGWISIAFVLLALCLIALWEFGMEEHGEYMIPT